MATPEKGPDDSAWAPDLAAVVVSIAVLGFAGVGVALLFTLVRHNQLVALAILSAAERVTGEPIRAAATPLLQAVLPGMAAVLTRQHAALPAPSSERRTAAHAALSDVGHDDDLDLDDLDDGAALVPPSTWLRWVNEQPHVILAAKTGGGKSTTAKAILAPRIAAGEDVFVVDPHSSEWFDMPSVGDGEDWPAVTAALETVHDEYQRRLRERAEYKQRTGRELPKTHFKRLTVLLDEANITQANIDKVERKGEVSPWERFTKTLGSGSRKVNISVVLLAQSVLCEDLGINGSMRANFTVLALDPKTIVTMLKGQPKARIDALRPLVQGRKFPATMEYDGQVYALDRSSMDRTSTISAAHCAWAKGYGSVPSSYRDEGDDELLAMLTESLEGPKVPPADVWGAPTSPEPTSREVQFIRDLYDAGITVRRELARKLYAKRGGDNPEYKGDGGASSAVKAALAGYATE